MSDDTYKLDTKNMDALLKALKNSMGTARVGILGAKSSRNGETVKPGKSLNANKNKSGKIGSVTTNATLGAVHEFGVPGRIPQRSFLRVPIAMRFPKALEKSGAFSPEELKRVIKEGSMRPWLERISILAVGIVHDAFDSGGFGLWPRHSRRYKNNTGMLLVDTQQLRNSITYEVK